MKEAPVCPACQSRDAMCPEWPYPKQGYNHGCTANWKCTACNRLWTISNTEQGHQGCITKF